MKLATTALLLVTFMYASSVTAFLSRYYGNYGGRDQEEGPVLSLISVRVYNMAPRNGTCLSPVWVGVHDGTFDLFDGSELASDSLERLAEDGDAGPISDDFADFPGTLVDGTAGDEAICPRKKATANFLVELDPSENYFLSFASQVLPSNDAFVANDDPMAIMIKSNRTRYSRKRVIRVAGTDVLDAGTEANDEDPESTNFLGQTEDDTGDEEMGNIEGHEGFMPEGSGGVLDADGFENADFLAEDYRVMGMVVSTIRAPKKEVGVLYGRPLGVRTYASGYVKVHFNMTDSTLAYEISAKRLNSTVIDGSLFIRGEEEPVVVLFRAEDLGDGRRVLRHGGRKKNKGGKKSRDIVLGNVTVDFEDELENDDLPDGMDMTMLWLDIITKNTYVIIKTEEYPDGEIGGVL